MTDENEYSYEDLAKYLDNALKNSSGVVSNSIKNVAETVSYGTKQVADAVSLGSSEVPVRRAKPAAQPMDISIPASYVPQAPAPVFGYTPQAQPEQLESLLDRLEKLKKQKMRA
jgi:hypothetical protein